MEKPMIRTEPNHLLGGKYCLLANVFNPLIVLMSPHCRRSKILLGAEERYRMGVWLDNKLLVETHNLLYYKVMTTYSLSK